MPPSTIFTKLRRGAVVDGSDVKGIQALADLVGSSYGAVAKARSKYGFFETGNGEGYFPKPEGGWTEEALTESFDDAYPIEDQLVRRCSQTAEVKETYFTHKHASASCPSLRNHNNLLPQHFTKSNFRDNPHLYGFVYPEESQYHEDILCHEPHGTGDGSAFRRLVNNGNRNFTRSGDGNHSAVATNKKTDEILADAYSSRAIPLVAESNAIVTSIASTITDKIADRMEEIEAMGDEGVEYGKHSGSDGDAYASLKEALMKQPNQYCVEPVLGGGGGNKAASAMHPSGSVGSSSVVGGAGGGGGGAASKKKAETKTKAKKSKAKGKSKPKSKSKSSGDGSGTAKKASARGGGGGGGGGGAAKKAKKAKKKGGVGTKSKVALPSSPAPQKKKKGGDGSPFLLPPRDCAGGCLRTIVPGGEEGDICLGCGRAYCDKCVYEEGKFDGDKHVCNKCAERE